MGHGRKSGVNYDSRPAEKISTDEFNGKSEKEIANILRNKEIEEMVLINSNGNVMAAFRGGRTGIDFASSPYAEEIRTQYADAIVIHNHPRGDEDFGGTLTPEDVRLMARGNWAGLSSVSNDPGRGNYTIKKLPGANSKDLTKAMKANRSAIESAFAEAYGIARFKAIQSGKTEAEARRTALKKGTSAYHKWWKTYLKKYGYEYSAWKEGNP